MEPFVKICGITRIEDAVAALDAKADALGFVAYPLSPRHLDLAKIARIISDLRQENRVFKAVGVFVDPDIETLEKHAEAGIDVFQLHGGESAELAEKAAETAEVWKALKPRSPNDIDAFADFPADKFLVDAFHERLPGGTGLKVDAETAARAVEILKAPVILAGGLTPDNVGKALAEINPFGVDVSGGVESAPGIKNRSLVEKFIMAAKKASIPKREAENG